MSAYQLDSEDKFEQERKQKLHALRDKDGQPRFPNHFRCSYADIGMLRHEHAEKNKETLEADTSTYHVAGRILLRRLMGKAAFFTIQDVSGALQLYVQWPALDDIGRQTADALDIGDIIGVVGTLFKTHVGELTLRAQHIHLLSKSFHPLPEKFHGLQDPELKARRRYLDIIMNPDARERFQKRSHIIRELRQYMEQAGFLEVETPLLHPIPGGANAKPFITHHNALSTDMYLRIAPELYLKRLIVAGFNAVFEINRNFRNEGLSTRHNPEFTSIEFYMAYQDYQWTMSFTESLIRYLANTFLDQGRIMTSQGTIDFGHPFEKMDMCTAIHRYNPAWQKHDLTNKDILIERLSDVSPIDQSQQSRWTQLTIPHLQQLLFEESTEKQLIQPTFITDYPIDISPLSRASDTRPGLTERFELFIDGKEFANGFSELNDPDDQRERFLKQTAQKDTGDDEAMYFDQEYLTAMAYGMPPNTGCGIGIDRLVMLLTGQENIKEAILFPHLKPQS